ncbi:hypothetical protein MYAM1_001649 [Malassezia yamatoensis]|uniref:Histone deacetylase complex subunit SAP18 n=1 Tax=Malassezia yamatoensis TaxID=253288 RepID=A0AAJ5YUH9_9BASI|nr:hypothetical protein MYAM1_001649 [Malassezia yamatoensis]
MSVGDDVWTRSEFTDQTDDTILASVYHIAECFPVGSHLEFCTNTRHLRDFRPHGPAYSDQYAVYVWPNTTLRELANLLYIAEPRYSDSMSTHDFRIVYYDPSAGMHRASAPVLGVTRATQQQIAALLKPAQHIEDTRSLLRDVGQGASNTARNDSANRTLAQMKFMPGDLLECAVSRSSSMQMLSTEQHQFPPRHSAMGETRHAKSSRHEWD